MAFFGKLNAQNYQALHGSDYAGSLGMGYNPSSIRSSPLSWDITLLGFQTKNFSNLYYLYKPQKQAATPPIALWFKNGTSKKYVYNSTNINLFNARARVNKKYDVSFGMNIRSNTHGKTSNINVQDTIATSNSFLDLNLINQPLGMDLFSSSWMETFAGLAKTLKNNKYHKLNAGMNVKITKGLAGIHVNAQNGRFQQVSFRNYPAYYFTSADLEFGYSSTLEKTYSSGSLSKNIKNFMSNTQGGIALDLGITWLVKKAENVFIYEDEMNEEYSWKIGVSVMDVGFSKYNYGLQSMKTTGVSPNARGVSLESKFDNTIQTIDVLNDTLATMVAQSSHLYGAYRFQNPTRMILNIDKRIDDHFFINGECTLSLYGIMPGLNFKTYEMGLATITPRYENRTYGFYMPFSINMYNQMWIGAAFKLGPIVAGLHNFRLLTSKNEIQNGGGYVALVISPYQKIKKVRSRGIKCPI